MRFVDTPRMHDVFKVMVLAGGPDRERPVSIKSGNSIAAALNQAGHEALLCDLTPSDTAALDRFFAESFDAIFPALHGPWGEGGGMQALLDQHQIPYVGCQPAAAKLAMDKAASKELFTQAGLQAPSSTIATRENLADTFTCPCVVKPVDEGSSIHLSICANDDEVRAALTQSFQDHDRMIVESYITGREFTVGVLGTGDGAEPLPPVEIRPAEGEYDYDAKYLRDDTDYLFKTVAPAITTKLQAAALTAHKLLGCRDLSRSDFILTDTGDAFILETNTLPGFTDHSLLPKSAAHAGLPLPALCDKLVRWAVSR